MCYIQRQGSSGCGLPHHISVMAIRGESSCLQSLNNTLTLHCQSGKFQGHVELPKFSAKPILFPLPSLFTTLYLKDADLWRSAVLSMQEDEVYTHLPLRQRRALLPQPGTLHN